MMLAGDFRNIIEVEPKLQNHTDHLNLYLQNRLKIEGRQG